MRLRTLPVSVAGVILACGLAAGADGFRLLPALICLIFALLAQVASNFANEYYDYRDGLDKPGRDGPRRGVTEGDISPAAMKRAAWGTLALACAFGCSLIYYGGWILLPAGILLALFAMAYSAGPYPLSRHALGEVTVIVCFGLAPVCLTFYVQTLYIDTTVALASISAGLLGANVLMINNYRDMPDDRAVGKMTLALLLGERWSRVVYFLNGFAAIALLWPVWASGSLWWLVLPAVCMALHIENCTRLRQRRGKALNPLLGATARFMLITCTLCALECVIIQLLLSDKTF